MKSNIIMNVYDHHNYSAKNEAVAFSSNNFISLQQLRNKQILNTTFIDSKLGITAVDNINIYGKQRTLNTADLSNIIPKLSQNAIRTLFNKNSYDTFYKISDYITVFNKYRDDKIKSVKIINYQSKTINILNRYVSICPIYYCGEAPLYTYVYHYLTRDDYDIWYVMHALTFGDSKDAPQKEDVTTFKCLREQYIKMCEPNKKIINNTPNINNNFEFFNNIIDKDKSIYDNVQKIITQINNIICKFEALKDRSITPSFNTHTYLDYIPNTSLVKNIQLDLNQQLTYSQYKIEVKTQSNSTYIIEKTYNQNANTLYGSKIFYTNDNNSFKTFCEKIYDSSSRVIELRNSIFNILRKTTIDTIEKHKARYNSVYFSDRKNETISWQFRTWCWSKWDKKCR